MKKTLYWGIVLLIFLVGCDLNSVNIGTPQDTLSEEIGYLVINIPESSNSRSTSENFASSDAAALANIYQIFVWSSSGIVYEVNTFENGGSLPTMSLPIGTYKLVAFAGYGANLSYPYSSYSILGTGSAKDITIESGKTTNITVTLRTPFFDAIMDEESLNVKSTSSLTIRVNIKNEFLTLWGTNFYYYSSPELYEGLTFIELYSIDPTTITDGNNEYSYNFPTPDNEGFYTYNFEPASLFIYDEWIPKQPGSSLLSGYYTPSFRNYNIPLATAIDGSTVKEKYVLENVEVKALPSFLGVSLVWE